MATKSDWCLFLALQLVIAGILLQFKCTTLVGAGEAAVFADQPPQAAEFLPPSAPVTPLLPVQERTRELEEAAPEPRERPSKAPESRGKPKEVPGRPSQPQGTNPAPTPVALPSYSAAETKQLRDRLVKTTKDWKFFESHSHHWVPLKGLRVLDVGMGQGPIGVVALSTGVKHYTGLDPAVRIHEVPKVRRIGVYALDQLYAPFPFTGLDMMAAHPGLLTLLPGTFETNRGNPALRTGNFDAATMFSVTEHLPNVTLVLDGIFNILSPGQLLVFSHHNYYGYSGHHMLPKEHGKFEPSNPKHQEVALWRHLDPSSSPYSDPNLNRVRLGDLMAVANVYFDCAWHSTTSRGDQGALTRSVLDPLHARGFRKEELLINRVAFACARRAEALPAPWLSTLPAHHPTTDGSYRPQAIEANMFKHVPARLEKLKKYLNIL